MALTWDRGIIIKAAFVEAATGELEGTTTKADQDGDLTVDDLEAALTEGKEPGNEEDTSH